MKIFINALKTLVNMVFGVIAYNTIWLNFSGKNIVLIFMVGAIVAVIQAILETWEECLPPSRCCGNAG